MNETKRLVQEHLADVAQREAVKAVLERSPNREERRLQLREWRRQQRRQANRNKGSLLRK